MAKEVKSSIQLTDKFLIERENTEEGKVMKTIDGSDLQSFIEDSQSRFTDEIELRVTNLETTVDSNATTIGENATDNETSHTEFDNRITENEDNIAANQAEIAVARDRTAKLEADNRVFGYYSLEYFPETAVDPQPTEGAFVLGKTVNDTLTPLLTGYAEVDTIRFNKEDLLGDKRTFTNIYGSDIIELVFYTNAAVDYKQAIVESRATFRVVLDFDALSINPDEDTIDIPVELVNGVGQNISTTVSEAPDLEIVIGFPFTVDVQPSPMPINRYCKCGVYPSLNTEEQVTLSSMTDALAPIGTIVIWPSNTIPEGWLRCDGRNSSSAKSGLNDSDKDEVDSMFTSLGFSKLPEIAGRYVAGVKGNQYSNAIHAFNSIGGVYNKQTGLPTNSNGNAKALTVGNAGAHGHTASMGTAGAHKHKYGNSNRSASGNKTNVFDARSEGAYQTDSAGNHTHNITISEASGHTHTVTGFNNDTRPNTIAYHYIIKYKHVITE